MDWNKYYIDQAGNGSNYDYFRGNVYQKGYGLGGTFKKFFKWIIPIFKTHAVPSVKSGLRHVGKEAASTVAKIATDIVAGKNFKDSAKANVTDSIDNLKNSFINNLDGKGLKRTSKINNHASMKKFKPNSGIKGNSTTENYIILKKRRKKKTKNKSDIFD